MEPQLDNFESENAIQREIQTLAEDLLTDVKESQYARIESRQLHMLNDDYWEDLSPVPNKRPIPSIRESVTDLFVSFVKRKGQLEESTSKYSFELVEPIQSLSKSQHYKDYNGNRIDLIIKRYSGEVKYDGKTIVFDPEEAIIELAETTFDINDFNQPRIKTDTDRTFAIIPSQGKVYIGEAGQSDRPQLVVDQDERARVLTDMLKALVELKTTAA